MCLYPTLRKNRKYIPNKKNGGIVPPLPLLYDKENDRIIEDKRVLLVPTACGKCMECMKRKKREWQVRLEEEIRTDKKGIFVTLTFSNESIKKLSAGIHKLEGYERDNEIATKAVHRFLERWRKEHKKSVKHWLITELGHEGTENIHLHGIIWTDKSGGEIEKKWKYGKVWDSKRKKGWVNEVTVGYITKYVNKTDQQHKYYKPKMLLSAGIGKGYVERKDSKINKFNGKETNENYTTRTGAKIAMPIYYRNKIYTEKEREELWQEKLDEEIRWVDGLKIDISKNEDNYYKALERARSKNKKLGYGDNKVNWNRKQYEIDRRNLKHETRIEKARQKELETEIEIINGTRATLNRRA